MPDFQAELQRSASAAHRRSTEPQPSADGGAQLHPLMRLQNQVGNAQVARLLAQRQEVPDEEELQAKHDPALLQREEMPEEEEELQAKHDPGLLQRGTPEEEEELQAKHDPSLISRRAEPAIGLEGGPVGDDVARRIDAVRGAGPGLSESTRNQMEPALGADFSSVRVHQDAESDALARSMTAKAFTTGSDIFLRQDANAGDSSLIAHELTHVVQQGSPGAGGGGSSGMTVGAAGDPLEHEADAMARGVVSGAGAQRRIDEGRPSPG